jgi:hypothetical protein
MSHRLNISLFSLLVCGFAPMAFAGEPSLVAADPANPVLARVGTSTIKLGDVCVQLGIDPAQAKAEPGLSTGLRDRTVYLLGLQRQARQTLSRLGIKPSAEEVERYLEEHRLTPNPPYVSSDELKELAEFRLAWRAYVFGQVNERNLQRHFENQRRRFDGSRFEIQLVSLAAPPGSSPLREATLQQLNQSFQGIGDAATFAMVAEGLEGAELLQGEYRGTGDLDPAVMDAVLKLQPGDVSPAFSSAVAVHVVRLIATQPGSLQREDVAGEVRAHMLIFLLEYLAAQSAEQFPFVNMADNDQSGSQSRARSIPP